MRKPHMVRPTDGRRAATLMCAAFLALVVGSCAGAPTEDTSQDQVAEDQGPPATEGADTQEGADDSGDQAVAVELPGLPIGGNSIVVSDTLQCADVGWTSPPDLPAWVSITVTGVAFTPEDGFDVSSESCPGDAPPCLGAGVQLRAGQRCYVAVTWTGPTLDSDRTMSFTSGRVTCAPDRLQDCQAFRAEVEAAGPQSIGLEPAPSELAPPPSELEPTPSELEPPPSELEDVPDSEAAVSG